MMMETVCGAVTSRKSGRVSRLKSVCNSAAVGLAGAADGFITTQLESDYLTNKHTVYTSSSGDLGRIIAVSLSVNNA